jgi:cardiolipin synthase
MISIHALMTGTPLFLLCASALYIANFAIAIAIIYSERKDPGATMAWILVLFLIPVLGICLYFFFSQNLSKRKIFKLTRDEKRVMTSALRSQERAIAEGSFNFTRFEETQWSDLIRLNQNYGQAYYTQDNSMDIITDGWTLRQELEEEIDKAEDYINIMFFIVKPDQIGKAFIAKLTEKARSGVTVRLLVDALGSRHIGNRHVKEFRKAGGKFARFFPPALRIFQYVNPKLNFRNHRKLAVIDGKVAFIGGYNVAREYMGLKKKFGFWRDTHARIRGGAVQDINYRFLLDWRASYKEDIDLNSIFFRPDHDAGGAGMQIVSSGPDSDHEQVKRALLKMITGARKRIFIQTPYFVPDAPILEALKMAANSGVDVRIMIPKMPDHIFVYWATWSYCGDMLRNGGRVFIYDAGFLHSKTMTVDGEVSTIGSTNFDRRSFKLNFECNAFIYDADEAVKMEEVFLNDADHGHELTSEMYGKRSLWIKIKEPISRLLSPVL